MSDQLGLGARERRGTDPDPPDGASGDPDAPDVVDVSDSSSPDESDDGATSATVVTDQPSSSDTDESEHDSSEADESDPDLSETDAAEPVGSTDSAPATSTPGVDRVPPVTTNGRNLFGGKGQLRARKVQRIVRRVDPWSVLKLSLIFYFCVWIMVIVAAVLLWGVAVGSGSVSSLENFIAEFLAFEEFHFNGDQLFQIFALGGLIGVFVTTAFTAILAVLFNLIADLTGGIRFTVIEEETARRIVGRG